MYGEPDIVLSFIRYAYWVMSVEADVCNYCKFVFDMARFTYTSINYTRGTSLRSEVPLVFVCSKSSTRVDDYNGSVRKLGCKRQTYAHSFVNLKRKKGISATPLNWLLNAFTLALNDSAPALVCLFTK